MKIKLNEMELIILLGLVATTSDVDKSNVLKKSRTIKKEHEFTVREIGEKINLKLYNKLNKKYKKIIDKSTFIIYN